jgi:hypothetical protein
VATLVTVPETTACADATELNPAQPAKLNENRNKRMTVAARKRGEERVPMAKEILNR